MPDTVLPQPQPRAYDALRAAFEARAISKYYWAVCAKAPRTVSIVEAPRGPVVVRSAPAAGRAGASRRDGTGKAQEAPPTRCRGSSAGPSGGRRCSQPPSVIGQAETALRQSTATPPRKAAVRQPPRAPQTGQGCVHDTVVHRSSSPTGAAGPRLVAAAGPRLVIVLHLRGHGGRRDPARADRGRARTGPPPRRSTTPAHRRRRPAGRRRRCLPGW